MPCQEVTMRTLLRAAFCAAFSLLAVACHGQSPMAASSAPALVSGVLTVRSNRTGQPIAGAAVTVNGQPFVTTSDGTVTLTAIPSDAVCVIDADGYLHSRVARCALGGAEYLQPDDGQMPYASLLYTLYGNGALYRTTTSHVTVFPDATFRNDRDAWRDLEWAVGKLNATRDTLASVPRPGTSMLPTWSIAARDDEVAEFKLVLKFDPSNEWFRKPGYENAGALTFVEYRGHLQVSATVVFQYLGDVFFGDHLKRAVIHEFTHAIGVGHLRDEDPEGIMGGSARGGAPLEFSPEEYDLLRYLTARPAGTVPVDDSTKAEASKPAAFGTTQTRLVCATKVR